MFKAFSLLLLLSLSSLESKSPSKCATELQEILFEPQSYAKEYMTKVAANFNLGKALLFTPQSDSYIQTFEQEWGVTIELFDASNICVNNSQSVCSAVQQEFNYVATVYNITIPEAYILSSLQISFTGTVTSNAGIGNYTLTSPAGTTVILSNQNLCESSNLGTFEIGFADDATGQFICDSPNEGAIISPTEPLSTFNGESTLGIWALNLSALSENLVNIVTFTYCQTNTNTTCPRDAMKALTNLPGFRYDSGSQTVYYTEDIFDDFGNFKQVTISRPVNGIFVKK